MNTYRLLRNNRETGPFTSDELIAYGFKPYDLIWVEGKSAGWRYPGEIAEFNVVAPVVENQPFERYAQKSSYLHIPDTSVLVPAHHLEDVQSVEQKLFTVPKTSIYVTLPGNAKGSTHRVILASKQFHKNNQTDRNPVINKEEVVLENKVELPSATNFFSSEELKDSSLALPENFGNSSLEENTEEHLLVDFQKPKKYSVFSKISLAVAILLFGFSLVLFTNAFIQKKQKAELAQMVQVLKSKNSSIATAKTFPQSSTLPLLVDPEYIIRTDALALASESLISITNPVLAEDLTTPAQTMAINTPIAVSEKVPDQTIASSNTSVLAQNNPEPVKPASWLINQLSIENSDVIDFSNEGTSSSIVITNHSPVVVELAEITITSLNEANQLIKKEVVKIENLQPGNKKEIKFLKTGKESSLQYSISSISYKSNGLQQ